MNIGRSTAEIRVTPILEIRVTPILEIRVKPILKRHRQKFV